MFYMPKKMNAIKDFHEAWWFLSGHPAFAEDFGRFKEANFYRALDIYVVKVSPKSNHICNDKRKNTKTQVWLECGKWLSAKESLPQGMKRVRGYYGAFCHDIKLDCGADTFEEAIVMLANKVLAEYRDYEREEE